MARSAFSFNDCADKLFGMNKQKAIAVNPTFGGTTSLDVTELNQLLADGWTVTNTAESSNGAILVVLTKAGETAGG